MRSRALMFIFIATSALAAEPKFHYNDCVKVVGGFYRNCHGRVKEDHGNNDFEVVLTCKTRCFCTCL